MSDALLRSSEVAASGTADIERGAGTAAVAIAGRWKDPGMVVRYAKAHEAGRVAVKAYFGGKKATRSRARFWRSCSQYHWSNAVLVLDCAAASAPA